MSENNFYIERNRRLNNFFEARRHIFAPIPPPSLHSPSSSSLGFSPSQIEQAINTALSSSTSEFSKEKEEVMAGNQTLRELAAPNLDQQPLCIEFPVIEGGFELKSGMIHLLPKFNGLAGEDPNKHLKEFQVVCSTMRPPNISEEQVKLRAFPFSLDGAAKDWLYYLPPGSIGSWVELKRNFLERYFPASKAANIRKEICGIRQMNGETLHEYWERFKRLCASCPNHQISEQLLIQYFYEGLTPMDRSMIDAASGGALMNKTPQEAKDLIVNMAANTQQFGTRQDMRRVNEVSSSSLEQQISANTQQISNLATLMQQLMVGNVQQVKACGICSNFGHPTDMCPTLQEEDCNAIGGFQGQPQRPQYGGRNNQQGFGSGGSQQPHAIFNKPPGFFQKPLHFQQRPQEQQGSSDEMKDMKEMMKTLASNTIQLQQTVSQMQSGMKNMENQIGQLATSLSNLESKVSNKIPSQTIVNPNVQNASAITLRSGKELTNPAPKTLRNDEEEEVVVSKDTHDANQSSRKHASPTLDTHVHPPPFPQRLAKSKKEEQEKEILDTFKKVQINIPLLEAIKQVPRYAKFLKDLCTNKRKLKGNEKVCMGEQVSAVFQKKLPPKCKDPGSFTIPCIIGDKIFERCMLDLGASISVMPFSIYKSLNLGPLEETGIIIQLADRSHAYPKGVVEDVLVKVNELVFPVDFYILDMEDEGALNPTPILLGRPFLMTARAKIDVCEGTLSMEFDGHVIKFSLFDAMKYPCDSSSLCSIEVIDAIDLLVQQVFELGKEDSLGVALVNNLELKKLNEPKWELELQDDIIEEVAALEAMSPILLHMVSYLELPTLKEKLSPSVVKAPELELKPLPGHLKYAFLGEKETLPVIISNNLTLSQEERLIRVLRDHKTAIAWSIADIKGISPSVCMHRILVEDGAKPTREPQRRLNPNMMEVVKKEIQKLLDAGIIYAISDSKWVSPVQVVPKKSGITVIKNEDNELVPTRVQTGWRMCIDYRKLNSATRKDHFPLPFMDQMLERLAGHSHFCFLDGYSGYNQIVIAPEDQEKTTFTCPYGVYAYRRMPFGLCNAPSTFQRCMVSIFSDYIENIIEVFMDDFSVYGNSFDKCLDNLSLVLERCLETNLVLNWEKCHFMVDQGIVLGHVISARGIEVDKAKVDLVKSLPYPTSVREVRSFLGHAGFYRRFIKDFSKISHPLCKLLQKEVAFDFNEECKRAFNKLKELLTSAPIIQPPNWSLPFEVMCDASDFAISAVLGQRKGKLPCVIYYASRTLNDAQLNYSTTEKEFLAVIFALEKFRSYLVGSKVVVYSDHAALKYLLSKKDAKPRLIRWILLLQEFDIEIKDKKGSENLVADHLSRLALEEDALPLEEKFPDEQLFAINVSVPWYADIVNFQVTKELPKDLTRAQKDKIKSDSKYYIWDDPYLWKHCSD